MSSLQRSTLSKLMLRASLEHGGEACWALTPAGDLLLGCGAAVLLPWCTPPSSGAKVTSVAPIVISDAPLLAVMVHHDRRLYIVEPRSRATLDIVAPRGSARRGDDLVFPHRAYPVAACALTDCAGGWDGSGDTTALAVGATDGCIYLCGTWSVEGCTLRCDATADDGDGSGRCIKVADAPITALALVGGGAAVCAAHQRGQTERFPPCLVAFGCADGALGIVQVDDADAALRLVLRGAHERAPATAITAHCDGSSLHVWSLHSADAGGGARLVASRGPLRTGASPLSGAASGPLHPVHERTCDVAALGGAAAWRFAATAGSSAPSRDAHRVVCLWAARRGGAVALRIFDQRPGAPTQGCAVDVAAPAGVAQLSVAALTLGARDPSGVDGCVELALSCSVVAPRAGDGGGPSAARVLVTSDPAPSLGPLVPTAGATWRSAVVELAMLLSHAESGGRRAVSVAFHRAGGRSPTPSSSASARAAAGGGASVSAPADARSHRERAFACLDALHARAMSAQLCRMLLLHDQQVRQIYSFVCSHSFVSSLFFCLLLLFVCDLMQPAEADTPKPRRARGGARVRCVGPRGTVVVDAAPRLNELAIDDPAFVIEWLRAELDRELSAAGPRSASAFEASASSLRALRAVGDALHLRLVADRRLDDASVRSLRREMEVRTRVLQQRAQCGAAAADAGAWLCDAAAAAGARRDVSAHCEARAVSDALRAAAASRADRRGELKRAAWARWEALAPACAGAALDFAVAAPLAARAVDALHVLQWQAIGVAALRSGDASLWAFLCHIFSTPRGEAAAGEEAARNGLEGQFDHRKAQLLLLYLALDAFFPPTSAAEDGAAAPPGAARPAQIVAAFDAYSPVSPTLSKVVLALWQVRVRFFSCFLLFFAHRYLCCFFFCLLPVSPTLRQLDAATPVARCVPRAVRRGVCVDASRAVRLLAHPGVSTLDPPELMYVALRQLLHVDAVAALLFARQLSVAQLVSVVDQGTLQRDASLPHLAIEARLACTAGGSGDADGADAPHRDSLLCEAMELLQRVSRALQQPPAPAAGASAVLLATVLRWMAAQPARFCKLAQFHFHRLARGGGGGGGGAAGLAESDLVAQLSTWSIARAQPELMDVAVSYFLQTHKPAVALALHRWHVWAVLQTLPRDEAALGSGGAGGASTATAGARLGAAQARAFGPCALVRAHLIHASLAQLPASMRDARRALPAAALPSIDGSEEFAANGVAGVGAGAGRGCIVRAAHAVFVDVMRLWCEHRRANGWHTRLATVAEELVAALESPSLSVEVVHTPAGGCLVDVRRSGALGPASTGDAIAGSAAVAQRWTVVHFLDYAPVRAATKTPRAPRCASITPCARGLRTKAPRVRRRRALIGALRMLTRTRTRAHTHTHTAPSTLRPTLSAARYRRALRCGARAARRVVRCFVRVATEPRRGRGRRRRAALGRLAAPAPCARLHLRAQARWHAARRDAARRGGTGRRRRPRRRARGV